MYLRTNTIYQMISKIKFPFFIILFFFNFGCMYAQSNETVVFLDMQTKGDKTLMIDINGKLIKEFSSEEKANGFVDESSELFHIKTFTTYDFTNGPLPIQKGKDWLLYDQKGNMVKAFANQYSKVGNPKERIYKAYSEIEGKSGQYMITYIDESGKELFNGEKFWEATEFKNHIAFAQLEDRNGEWVKLNSLEKKIYQIPEYSRYSLGFVKRESNLLSSACFILKDYCNMILIDNHGEIVFDLIEKMGKYNCEFVKISDSLIVCSDEYTFVFFDHQFRKIKEISPAYEFIGMNSSKFCIETAELSKLLFDKDFNQIPVDIQLKNNEDFRCIDFNENYLILRVSDTITNSSYYVIYNHITSKIELTTHKSISKFYGDRLVERDPYIYAESMISILNLQGQVLYTVEPHNKQFRCLETTKQHNPEKIIYIRLDKDEEISALSKYKNIENLEFHSFSFSELPKSVKSLEKLEKLAILHCEELISLPSWLSELKNIESLYIVGCPKLKNIEEFIENSPKLKSVLTSDYKFADGFVEKMEIQKPYLKITNGMSLNFSK
jgi:hypothetical protein